MDEPEVSRVEPLSVQVVACTRPREQAATVTTGLESSLAGRCCPGRDAYGSMTRVEFTVSREDRPSGTVLTVHGDLDVATVQVLRTQVEDALAAAPSRLSLDLTPTTFIDSTGCRELVRAARGGATSGTPVELVVPPDNWRVRRVVDFMQFGALLPVHDQAPYA